MQLVEARHPPARHPDAQGVRERHHRDDRARRLDQRGAAPARDGARGRREARRSTTSRGSASACPCSRTCGRAASTSCRSSSTIGGIPPLMKMLLDAGLLHGDCLTVTGKHARRRISQTLQPYPEDQDIVRAARRSHQARQPPGRALRQSRARRRRRQDHRQGRACVSPAERACSTPRRRRSQAILDGARRGRRRHRHPLRRPEGRPRHARDAESRPARSWARDSATRSRSSPTAVSPAAATASWSATSRRKPQSAGRSRLVSNGDPITHRCAERARSRSTWPTRDQARAPRAWRAPKPLRDARRAREVRTQREQRVAGRNHRRRADEALSRCCRGTAMYEVRGSPIPVANMRIPTCGLERARACRLHFLHGLRNGCAGVTDRLALAAASG